MTANQLHGIARRHGYEIAIKEDGQPFLRRIRPGAWLPDRVVWLFKGHRHLFAQHQAIERQEGNELHQCTVCRAMVNLELAPCFNPETSPEMFGCTRVSTRNTPGCPYRGNLL